MYMTDHWANKQQQQKRGGGGGQLPPVVPHLHTGIS